MSGFSPLARSGTLFGYSDLSDSIGLDTDGLLAQIGLTREALEDPDCLIPVDRIRLLLEATSRLPGAENFGLRLGARRRVANLGIVGLVIREEPTALSALKTLCRYLQLVTSSLQIDVEEAGPMTIIREELAFALGTPVRQSIELAISMMVSILVELMPNGWTPKSVHFRHRAPRDLLIHRRTFRCPVNFNADFNGIVCASPDLHRQLPDRDARLSRFVQAELEKSLSETDASSLTVVRQVITGLMPFGQCNTLQVARHLKVSTRTLHRLLARHEVSFSGLLSQIRRDLVMQQLRHSDRQITQIAQMLAFESSSAFGHWFQKTFGTSAREWRKQQREISCEIA